VLGSATHSFELMLSAFILGLALGAFWIRGRADRVADPMRLLGIVQFAMGALAIATLAVYLDAFGWMASLIGVLEENEGGYRVYNVARYGIALAVMLPSTFCAGITLPLITRMLLSAGSGERAIGAVYAWNTLGSIVGVSLAALWLMPLVGEKPAISSLRIGEVAGERATDVEADGLAVKGHFVSERENVDEDICAIGAGAHEVEVDLMQPLDPDRKPAVHATPLNHVGLWVDDLPKAVEWMSANGVRFAPGGIRRGAAGHDICFIHPKGNDEFPLSGEGVLIELVQAPPEIVAALG